MCVFFLPHMLYMYICHISSFFVSTYRERRDVVDVKDVIRNQREAEDFLYLLIANMEHSVRRKTEREEKKGRHMHTQR